MARTPTPVADPSPKTTRAPPRSQRQRRQPGPTKQAGRTYDAAPDKVDIRDWFYQPTLLALPRQIVNIDDVPEILDQGTEGACTGFALAAVIQFLLAQRGEKKSVSPRMLYELARMYDEWPGVDYEGSSARGAMKGWVRHGVCSVKSWPHKRKGAEKFTPEISLEARDVPGGAFFRVSHRQIRDMHAALHEVGALYMTLLVHDGWTRPAKETVSISYQDADGNAKAVELPVITRGDHIEVIGGHAVAIVGYTNEGFIIQNSWGPDWGSGGFALLPYEDYLLHSTDVWVAQLGVPVKVDLWRRFDTTEGIQQARAAISLDDIRPYTIDVGNNGTLSRSGNYWTTETDVERLFTEHIWGKMQEWRGQTEKKRVLFYMHGGLNDESTVAKRIIAYRDVMLANYIYPVHIMWETGWFDTLKAILADLFTDADTRAGGAADWLKRVREGLGEARDWSLELTTSLPGRALWGEMKENARLASLPFSMTKKLYAPSGREPERGAMTIVADKAQKAIAGLQGEDREGWEIHIVGHSAGSILAGYALPLFIESGVKVESIQFMAPAMTVPLFRNTILPHVRAKKCPAPELYILSDSGERDDDVLIYGKSLLYLVSNAFENKRPTPLLGMERFLRSLKGNGPSKLGGAMPDLDQEVAALLKDQVTIAGAEPAGSTKYPRSRSDSHGGFDSDVDTLNSLIWRILGGKKPIRPFTAADLK